MHADRSWPEPDDAQALSPSLAFGQQLMVRMIPTVCRTPLRQAWRSIWSWL
jgi:hypothetical protein